MRDTAHVMMAYISRDEQMAKNGLLIGMLLRVKVSYCVINTMCTVFKTQMLMEDYLQTFKHVSYLLLREEWEG